MCLYSDILGNVLEDFLNVVAGCTHWFNVRLRVPGPHMLTSIRHEIF